jgi:hypothetical protein
VTQFALQVFRYYLFVKSVGLWTLGRCMTFKNSQVHTDASELEYSSIVRRDALRLVNGRRGLATNFLPPSSWSLQCQEILQNVGKYFRSSQHHITKEF